MKKNSFVVCPECNSVKLEDVSSGEILWEKLNCFEQSAILTIKKSEILPILFGKTEMQGELCPDCNLVKHEN